MDKLGFLKKKILNSILIKGICIWLYLAFMLLVTGVLYFIFYLEWEEAYLWYFHTSLNSNQKISEEEWLVP